MPQLVTFKGRPIKRRRRHADGLLLNFYGEKRGDQGDRLVVTDAEWDLFGRVDYVRRESMPDRWRSARTQVTPQPSDGWLAAGY